MWKENSHLETQRVDGWSGDAPGVLLCSPHSSSLFWVNLNRHTQPSESLGQWPAILMRTDVWQASARPQCIWHCFQELPLLPPPLLPSPLGRWARVPGSREGWGVSEPLAFDSLPCHLLESLLQRQSQLWAAGPVKALAECLWGLFLMLLLV